MDKRELFDRTQSLWPDAIVVTKSAASDGALNAIYWRIEDRLGADDWAQLAAWAFHQALCELAETRIAAGKTSLSSKDVSFESFDRWIRMNLRDESWAKVRREYDANLG